MQSPSTSEHLCLCSIKKTFPILVGITDGGVVPVDNHIHFCEAKYYLQTTVGRKTDENFLEEGNEEMGRSISDLLAPSLLTMQKENVRKRELQLKATPSLGHLGKEKAPSLVIPVYIRYTNILQSRLYVLPVIVFRLYRQFKILPRPRPPLDLSRPSQQRLAAAILHNTIARYTEPPGA